MSIEASYLVALLYPRLAKGIPLEKGWGYYQVSFITLRPIDAE